MPLSKGRTYLSGNRFVAVATEALGLRGDPTAAEVRLQQAQHGVQTALASLSWWRWGSLRGGARCWRLRWP